MRGRRRRDGCGDVGRRAPTPTSQSSPLSQTDPARPAVLSVSETARAVRCLRRYNYSSSHAGGSVAEWLACWTRVQKAPGSNRSRDAVGLQS